MRKSLLFGCRGFRAASALIPGGRAVLALALAGLTGTASAAQSGPKVTLGSLLAEMVDLERLARRPKPMYNVAQASSYDRASKSPAEGWFANADAGKFLRVERVRGRNEYVMADLKGPGVVVRIWSANPVGTIRFYFDGETEARFVWPMPDLLQGKVPPFVEPFAYNASSGTNLYFPIPYARNLKITTDESMGDRVRSLYYHVNYRSYPEEVAIESLTGRALVQSASQIAVARAALTNPAQRLPRRAMVRRVPVAGHIRSGRELTLVEESRGGAVYEIRARLQIPGAPKMELPWTSPFQLHNALRLVRIRADFDGERCVDVPLGDLFGSAPGVNPFVTLPAEMHEDGWMVCRFVMPFARSASVVARNDGPFTVSLEAQVRLIEWRFGDDSYHFHAQWIGERTHTRPMRDMNFLDVAGEGLFVGAALFIANPVPTWWGEGDEKIYVDGEAFPSTFGTGTEDYFGYAWGSPRLYARPYHAQPRCDGPGTRGHNSEVRWHIFDVIPYTKSFRFDMELWHWAEVNVAYDRAAFWYARPGGTPPKEIEANLLLPVEIAKPETVKGAIEGETMEIVSKTGGETEVQAFFELSNGQQLWWRDARPGDKLTLAFLSPSAGEFVVLGNFCQANDYGIHRIRINGKEATPGPFASSAEADPPAKGSSPAPIDFWSSSLKWSRLSLGVFTLAAGRNTLEIECVGSREGAIPRRMFGLDYILVRRPGP